ncbi:MAG: YkgJ family cysteine cluster protein [Acidobacteriota bacterium]
MNSPQANGCLECGACCAYYRVAFHWSEADDATPGGVPVQLTEDLDAHRRAMRGTASRPSRCVALEGVVGRAVRCTIYDRRPSVCREFTPAWEDPAGGELCRKAREGHGLPGFWEGSTRGDRAA